jgi:microcystin-dependent protein
MKKLNVLLLVIFSLLLNAKTNAQTAVLSSGMSIQGIARDNSNQALANMDQDLVFTVYYYIGASTTPTVIQTRTATVRTDNFGVFSYVFVIDQAQFNLISNNSSYLKVSNSASVVFSDEKLQTVPYAIYAQNGVPTGSIMPFIGTVAPIGWLLCDGTAIPSGSFYDNLRNLAGANTPDLRAMFLRGTGSGNGKVGPALKEVVQDDVKAHLHAVTLTTSNDGSHWHPLNRRSNSDNGAYDAGDSKVSEESAVTTNRQIIGQFSTLNAGSHTHTVNGNTAVNGSATETRPINYGVNYIIKL